MLEQTLSLFGEALLRKYVVPFELRALTVECCPGVVVNKFDNECSHWRYVTSVKAGPNSMGAVNRLNT